MDLVKIISDGSCDWTMEEAAEKNVGILPFYVSFDSKEYFRENLELDTRDFYQRMVDAPTVFPKTSCPSSDDYFMAFEQSYQAGESIICICITQKFSGSYNAAITGKQMLLEKYPDAKIEVIDSTVNTVLQGLVVREAARMLQAGHDFETIVRVIHAIKGSGRIYFTVSNLEYLRAGGRIGKLASIVGKIIKINPMIVLRDGEIHSSGISIGRKAALNKLIDIIKKKVQEVGDIGDYRLSIGYGYDIKEAEEFKQRILAVCPQIEALPIAQIGSTIAVHTGPYPIGLGLVKKYETAL